VGDIRGSRFTWVVAACAVALALCAASSVTAVAQAATPATLTVLGDATKPRVVPMEVEDDELSGVLDLMVRASQATHLRVAYYRDGAPRKLVAPSSEDPDGGVSFDVIAPDGTVQEQAPAARKGRVVRLALRFTLPRVEDPSSLGGTVVVVPVDAAGKPKPIDQPAVAVTGEVAPTEGVTVVPAKGEVRASCRYFRNCRGHGDIALEGPGVPALLERLAPLKDWSRRVALEKDGKFGTSVTVTGLERDADDPNRATARIELNGSPWPGSYEGSLSLSQLSAGSPALPIVLESRVAAGWALLTIVLGVFAAGLLLNHLGLRRRKEQIGRMLRDAAQAYCVERDALGDATNRVWSLDDVIECDRDGKPLLEDPSWMYYDELSSVSRIGSAVRWARNDADLDEAQAAALLVVGRIGAWRIVALEMGALTELAASPPSSSFGSSHWDRTAVAHDTAVMLEAARREPADVAGARALRDRVRRQVAWHGAVADAWRLRARAERRKGTEDAITALDLKALVEGAEPAATRTDAQQDTLLYELGVRYRRLRAAARLGPTDGLPQDLPASSASPTSEQLDRAVAILDEYSGRPGAAMRALSLSPGALSALPAPAGDASPRRPAAPAQSRSAAAAPSPRSYLRRLFLVDFLLSVAVVVLTSTAYAVTVYDSTWGSPADWATAFAAGFTGQVAVKWAALPLYRSLRIRAKKDQAAAQPAGQPAGAKA
jgi:hypothetical protein